MILWGSFTGSISFRSLLDSLGLPVEVPQLRFFPLAEIQKQSYHEGYWCQVINLKTEIAGRRLWIKKLGAEPNSRLVLPDSWADAMTGFYGIARSARST